MTKLYPHQVNAEIVKNIIRNLKVDCANASQVVIKSGSTIGSDDGDDVLAASSDITVDITVSGVNGLDTGTEAISTWYYVYLIKNIGTNTVAGLLSASSTAPTLPSGYTKKRLISAVRNQSSGDFVQFTQIGDEVELNSFTLVSTHINATTITIDASSYMPPISRRLEVMARARHDTLTSDASFFARPQGASYQRLIAFIDGTMASAIFDTNSTEIMTDVSQKFDIICTANNQYINVANMGYTLDL